MIERAATILTIVACVAVLSNLAYVRYSAAATSPAPGLINVGDRIQPADGIPFAAPKTVLVGLSSTCKFCSESMDAFRRLNEFVRDKQGSPVRILGIGLEAEGVLQTYINSNGLSEFATVAVARESSLAPVASRTPTLLIVDGSGKVVAAWAGLMRVNDMEAVISRHLNSEQ
jgi:hypothetical protein